MVPSRCGRLPQIHLHSLCHVLCNLHSNKWCQERISRRCLIRMCCLVILQVILPLSVPSNHLGVFIQEAVSMLHLTKVWKCHDASCYLSTQTCRTTYLYRMNLNVFVAQSGVVSSNRGTRKSSIFIGFSIINHPAIGVPLFMEPPDCDCESRHVLCLDETHPILLRCWITSCTRKSRWVVYLPMAKRFLSTSLRLWLYSIVYVLKETYETC